MKDIESKPWPIGWAVVNASDGQPASHQIWSEEEAGEVARTYRNLGRSVNVLRVYGVQEGEVSPAPPDEYVGGVDLATADYSRRLRFVRVGDAVRLVVPGTPEFSNEAAWEGTVGEWFEILQRGADRTMQEPWRGLWAEATK